MYREQVLLPEGFVVEVALVGRDDWRLSLRKGKKILIEYKASKNRELRSVEQLRYDFEKDVESALRKGR